MRALKSRRSPENIVMKKAQTLNPAVKLAGIRRSISAIACTAVVTIVGGCGGSSSSPDDGPADQPPPSGYQPTPAPQDPTPEDKAAKANERAQGLLAGMSLDDKVDMLHGELNNYYGFYNGPIAHLGIPALTMADGPAGVRIASPDVNDQRATQLPSAIAVGATWDVNLAEDAGKLMGEEAHSTGHNVQLAPAVDIARVAQFGRVFESYGEDPLLSGTLGAASIRGIQASPVISVVKHYELYLQETKRRVSNAVIDERTLRRSIPGHSPSHCATGAPVR
jgi:beta-glucosidase